MKKKKVLFTATVDSHILLFHLPYLRYFKEKGYEVHVATNGQEKIPYCDKKYTMPFARSPYKIDNLKALKQLKKIINQEKYEIIHTHTPMGAVVTRLAAKKARTAGTRVIYTAHGFHFFKGSKTINWLLFYPVEKYLAKYTDTLITINEEDYQLAKKKFKKCHDIKYVKGIGLDEEKFNFVMTTGEKTKLKTSLGLNKEDFILIYPAELSKRKRQTWLIESLKDLLYKEKNIHLLLPGKDSLNQEHQKLITKYHLENQIHLLGFRNDIPKLLTISDIALSSSNQEGLAVNVIEAMYLGLPLVITDCRGNRDLVEDQKTGYLIPINNQQMFRNKVEELYKNKDLRATFKKSNQEKAKEYLLKNILPVMIEIYEDKKYEK